jgi:hypothetical protein
MNMQITERDKRIVELIGQARVATAKQVQIAEFGLEHPARCQSRLNGLVSEQWLDVLNKQKDNKPFIYYLGRNSSNAKHYLRLKWGDQKLKSCMTRIWHLPHQLGITECRVRVVRACKDNAYQLLYWQRAEDLQLIMRTGLIPDAYFVVQRLVQGELHRSCYFLEYELSNKSSQVIEDKLKNYYRLISSGQFSQLFGIQQTPRVLFVFAPFHNVSPKPRVLGGLKTAAQLGATFARFIILETLTETAPAQTLTASIWNSPNAVAPGPLL